MCGTRRFSVSSAYICLIIPVEIQIPSATYGLCYLIIIIIAYSANRFIRVLMLYCFVENAYTVFLFDVWDIRAKLFHGSSHRMTSGGRKIECEINGYGCRIIFFYRSSIILGKQIILLSVCLQIKTLLSFFGNFAENLTRHLNSPFKFSG